MVVYEDCPWIRIKSGKPLFSIENGKGKFDETEYKRQLDKMINMMILDKPGLATKELECKLGAMTEMGCEMLPNCIYYKRWKNGI